MPEILFHPKVPLATAPHIKLHITGIQVTGLRNRKMRASLDMFSAGIDLASTSFLTLNGVLNSLVSGGV